MKNYTEFINEKFDYNKQIKYTSFPESKKELKQIIQNTIKKEGVDCNLNFIDTSKIKDMSFLFDNSDFNGNISKWNVMNVENMNYMFSDSLFNGDISKWGIGSVKSMVGMFFNSSFKGNNGNIDSWNVKPNVSMNFMFYKTPIEKNPPKWYNVD